MSDTDIFLRIALSVFLLFLADTFILPVWLLLLIVTAASYGLLTCLFEYCPIYHSLGYRTYPKRRFRH